MNCLGPLIQGSRHLYLLSGERRRLFLIAKPVERLVRIEKYVLTAAFHARLGTRLRIVGTHLLEHGLVSAALGTCLVHNLPFKCHVLRLRETGRQQ